ncbi:MAG: hypothetical protein OEU32_02320 [Acidimicrobiia bacterium]|nr:hypothetical protein [Acidimicrobiia bacterium]
MNSPNAVQRNLIIAIVVAVLAGAVTFFAVGGNGDATLQTAGPAPDETQAVGEPDPDVLVGDPDDDILVGGSDDVLLGDLSDRGGDDVLTGDPDDTILGGSDDASSPADRVGPAAAPQLVAFCPGVRHLPPPDAPTYPSDVTIEMVFDEPITGTVTLEMPPAFGAEPVSLDLRGSDRGTLHVPIDSLGPYQIVSLSLRPDGTGDVDLLDAVAGLLDGAGFEVGPENGPLWDDPACAAYVDADAFLTVP